MPAKRQRRQSEPPYSLAVGTRVVFHLKDAPDWGCDIEKLDGETAHVMAQATRSWEPGDIPDKDFEYYDIQFDVSGVYLSAVSGYHLEPAEPLLTGPVEAKKLSAIDRLAEAVRPSDTRPIPIPATINLRYRFSKSEYHTGGKAGQWFEQLTMWIDLETFDSEVKPLTYLEATAFDCPSPEEIENSLGADIRQELAGVSFDEGLKALSVKLHVIFKAEAENLSSLPKPE